MVWAFRIVKQHVVDPDPEPEDEQGDERESADPLASSRAAKRTSCATSCIPATARRRAIDSAPASGGPSARMRGGVEGR